MSVGPLCLATAPSGNYHRKLMSKRALFKHCVTLSSQDTGKPIFLQGRKGIHRECVFKPLSCRNSLAPKAWTLQFCSEDLNLRVCAVCLGAFSHLSNTYLGDTGTAHEEADCGNMSQSAGSLTVVTSVRWHSTVNRPKDRSCEPPMCFKNPRGGTKLALSKVRKWQLDGFSKCG